MLRATDCIVRIGAWVAVAGLALLEITEQTVLGLMVVRVRTILQSLEPLTGIVVGLLVAVLAKVMLVVTVVKVVGVVKPEMGQLILAAVAVLEQLLGRVDRV